MRTRDRPPCEIQAFQHDERPSERACAPRAKAKLPKNAEVDRRSSTGLALPPYADCRTFIAGSTRALSRFALRLYRLPALLAEAHVFRKLRSRRCVIRGDHWVVVRKAPASAVLVRCKVVSCAQVALQALEFTQRGRPVCAWGSVLHPAWASGCCRWDLLLIAYDVPVLRKPVARFTSWGAEQWARLRVWLGQKLGPKVRNSEIGEATSEPELHSPGVESGA